MRKLTTYLAVIFIATASHTVMAQHSGHGMGGMGTGSSGVADTQMHDMQKMIAMQASENQKEEFASWTHRTETLKQRVSEVQLAVGTNDFLSKVEALKATVAQTKVGQEKFELGLTAAQKTGLKKPIEKVAKANDELARAVEKAIVELEKSQNGTGKASLENVDKLAAKLAAEQKKLGAEMGI